MITSTVLAEIETKIEQRAMADKRLLDQIRREIRPLTDQVRQIKFRPTTATALVAADGGNAKIAFDPYLFELVRVVDSSGEEILFDVVSPATNTEELFRQHLDNNSPLAQMMSDLEINSLWELSPMIPPPGASNPKPSWVQAYRELGEWAALYHMLQGKFVTDTLIVKDGLLRSKVFAGEQFARLAKKIERAIEQNKRNIYLVGLAKKSKVLTRYRLAFALEDILNQNFPCYVKIPGEIESQAYNWPEYVSAEGMEGAPTASKFTTGKMFMVKFGQRSDDPIWPLDIFISQLDKAPQIMGYLLGDARNGFPVPFYPRCLQEAHERAALVGFDREIIAEAIVGAIGKSLNPQERGIVDIVRLQDDVTRRRYE